MSILLRKERKVFFQSSSYRNWLYSQDTRQEVVLRPLITKGSSFFKDKMMVRSKRPINSAGISIEMIV